MSSLHRANDVTKAVLAVLTSANLTVGDAEKPAAGGWQGTPGQSTFTPYVVVYNLVGGSTDGPIGDPDADASPTYQFTSVGGTPRSCETVADLARAAFLNAAWTIPGRKVILAEIDMLGGAVRDDDEAPPIWFSPDRYRLWTVPDA